MKTQFKIKIIATLLTVIFSAVLLVACAEEDGGNNVLTLADADNSDYSYANETLVNKVGGDLDIGVEEASDYGDAVLNVEGEKYYSITRAELPDDEVTALLTGANLGTYTDGMTDEEHTANITTITGVVGTILSQLAVFNDVVYALGGNSSYSCDGAPGVGNAAVGNAANLTCTLALDANDTAADLTPVEANFVLVTFDGTEAEAQAAALAQNTAIAGEIAAPIATAARIAVAGQTDADEAQATAEAAIVGAITAILNDLEAPAGAKEFTLTLSAVPFEIGTKEPPADDGGA